MAKARKSRGWSREENAKLIELRAAGTPWKGCAQALGRTESSVMQHGAHLKTNAPRRIRWTAAENDLLRALRAAGLLWRQIAERMGLKQTVVEAQMSRLRKAERDGAIDVGPAAPAQPQAQPPRPDLPDTLAAVRRRAGLDDDGRAERIAARRAENALRSQRAHQVRMGQYQTTAQAASG